MGPVKPLLRFFVLILFFAVSVYTFGDNTNTSLRFSLDFDQILSIRAGLSLPFNETLGGRISFGASPFGIATMTYSGTGYYHFRAAERRFQLDGEVGILLGYFNYFEGEYVDWDPIIDDPFHGIIPGAVLVWGYRGKTGQYSLITGAGPWWEWQRDSGWKGPRIMPVAGLRYSLP